MRKIKKTNSEIMKELMKHVPAIKNFIEERTQALQEISDGMVKKFLTEAYKLPFLFPVRIIVSEEKFVNFLFDMRKELFEGKKIDITTQETNKATSKKADVEPETPEVKEEVKAKEEIETTTVKTAKTKKATKVVKKTTESVDTKAVKSPTTSQTSKTKKEKDLV